MSRHKKALRSSMFIGLLVSPPMNEVQPSTIVLRFLGSSKFEAPLDSGRKLSTQYQMLRRFNPLSKLVSSCCLLFRLTLIIPKAKITIPTWPFHGNISSSYPHYINILLRRWGSTMSWCEKPQHSKTPFSESISQNPFWKPSNVQTPSPSPSRYRSVSFYITGHQCSLGSSRGSTAHSGAVKTLVTARHRVSQHQVTYLHRWFAGLPIVFAFLRLVVGGDIQQSCR